MIQVGYITSNMLLTLRVEFGLKCVANVSEILITFSNNMRGTYINFHITNYYELKLQA